MKLYTLVWNSRTGTVTLTPKNAKKTVRQCSAIPRRGKVSRIDLQSLLRRLAFADQLLPGVRYFKRSKSPLLRHLPQDCSAMSFAPSLSRLLTQGVAAQILQEHGLLRFLHPTYSCGLTPPIWMGLKLPRHPHSCQPNVLASWESDTHQNPRASC